MKRLLLLISLFGFMAQAMEPIIITGKQGTKVELTPAQQVALEQCEALQPFLEKENTHKVNNNKNIDLSGVSYSFVSPENIRDLAEVINDNKYIATITDAKKNVELFRLADYILAPREVVQSLASRAEEIINTKMPKAELAGILSCRDFDSMEIALQSIRKLLEEYRWNINDRLKIKKLPQSSEKYLDLSAFSYLIGENKLGSLKGIEKCVEFPDRIDTIRLSHQNIKEIDFVRLKKLFPSLTKIYLENNNIERISVAEPLRNLEVHLRNNPLRSITIKKPEQSNSVKFITDMQNVKINFIQTGYSKKLTWLKSFAAKSKLLKGAYVPPLSVWLALSGVGMVTGLGVYWVGEIFERMGYTFENLEQLAVVNNQEIIFQDNILEKLAETKLADLIQKYGQK